MRNLQIVLLIICASFGGVAWGADMFLSHMHRVNSGFAETTVTGTWGDHTSWDETITYDSDLTTYEALVDEAGLPVVDETGNPVLGKIVSESTRNEQSSGVNEVLNGVNDYTTDSTWWDSGFNTTANGVGSGGGQRDTVVNVTLTARTHTRIVDIDGTFNQEDKAYTYIDNDGVNPNDGVYDTLVSEVVREVGFEPFPGEITYDSTNAYIVIPGSYSDTTNIYESYMAAYSDMYR